MGLGRLIGRNIYNKWETENKELDDMVKQLNEKQQLELGDRFDARRKKMSVGYICWVLYGSHYAYTGKWLKQVVFWATLGGLFGWWFLDLFLMFFVIDTANRRIKWDIINELLEEGFQADSHKAEAEPELTEDEERLATAFPEQPGAGL